MTYYTAMIILVWLALLVLAILVHENTRIQKRDKIIMYITYAIVALASFDEWLGVQFNGNPNVPEWLLRFVKFWDYVLTPLAGGAIIFHLKQNNIWKKILLVVLIANTVFQLAAAFTGWMTIVNNGYYEHGPAYFVYIIIYAIVIFIVMVEFILYGRVFTRRNMISLYAIVGFVIIGILLQEIFGHGVRTAYISLATGLSLLYIHYIGFSQILSDKQIQEQEFKISIDPLTGIFSRYAYMTMIDELDDEVTLPEDLVVFSIDINGLKSANDTLGHIAGDELICAAANCIKQTFSKYGQCYRVGGDEFIVIAHIKKDIISKLKNEFKHLVSEWQGKENKSLSVAIGSAAASQNPGVSLEKLITLSDKEMYKAKSDYYRNSGIERRQN